MEVILISKDIQKLEPIINERLGQIIGDTPYNHTLREHRLAKEQAYKDCKLYFGDCGAMFKKVWSEIINLNP